MHEPPLCWKGQTRQQHTKLFSSSKTGLQDLCPTLIPDLSRYDQESAVFASEFNMKIHTTIKSTEHTTEYKPVPLK